MQAGVAETLEGVLENLSFYVSVEYNLVRFKECVYQSQADVLEVTFIYDESIESGISELKKRLEKDFIEFVMKNVGEGTVFIFAYEKRYIDSALFKLKTMRFLNESFSVFSNDFSDDSVEVLEDESFIVNIFLPKQVLNFIAKHRAWPEFMEQIKSDYFIEVSFNLVERKDVESAENYLEELKKLIKEERIVEEDKTMDVGGKIEYYMGQGIKGKPIKIKHLQVRQSDQIIAGHIEGLTRREYTSKKDGSKKPFYTFALNDFESQCPCVYFVPGKSLFMFDKLEDGTFVVLVGVNGERNGRVSFVVSGISLVKQILVE